MNNKERIQRARFRAKLSGSPVIDFGFISDRKAFLDFCVEEGYLKYSQDYIENDRVKHVYQVQKDFRYRAAWTMDSTKSCTHNVGGDGGMLVDDEYRAIGYSTYVKYKRR